jgi:DNA invertase Pin-like site-specific DNA recombinase
MSVLICGASANDFKKAKYRECFEDIVEAAFSGGIKRPGFDRAMLSLNPE